MSKYIALVNWTEKGVAEVKEAPQRVDKTRALAKSMGGDLEQIYMTMGAYDLIAIIEMPSDEKAAEFALRAAGNGYIRTTTLKAFDEASFRKIAGSL